MPTSNPVQVAIGDIRKISITTYNNAVLSVGLLESEQIGLHFEGNAPENVFRLPFDVPEATDNITAVALAEILHVSYSSGRVCFYARWNLDTREIDLPRFILPFAASKPSLQPFGNPFGSQLVLHYIDNADDQRRRVSSDGGVSWSAAVDPGNPNTDNNFVDVSVSPLQPFSTTWAANVG